jgi:hypothetical protein
MSRKIKKSEKDFRAIASGGIKRRPFEPRSDGEPTSPIRMFAAPLPTAEAGPKVPLADRFEAVNVLDRLDRCEGRDVGRAEAVASLTKQHPLFSREPPSAAALDQLYGATFSKDGLIRRRL